VKDKKKKNDDFNSNFSRNFSFRRDYKWNECRYKYFSIKNYNSIKKI